MGVLREPKLIRKMRRILLVLLFMLVPTCLRAQTVVTPPFVWPGQTGNAVGYAAAPGWPGSFTATACPATPASGTNWTNATLVKNCTYNNTGSGNTVSCNFCIFEYVDFRGTTLNGNATAVTGSNVIFIGDRFQSNAVVNGNLSVSTSNQYFLWDSITPLASFVTSPTGSTWPSGGAGANSALVCTTGQTTLGCNGTLNNAIDGQQGYQFGFKVFNGTGVLVIDHCDIWGYGNSIAYQATVTGASYITNNWIHDPANPDWSNQSVSITSFSGTSGNITFNANMSSFLAGESIMLEGFTSPNTALNNTRCQAPSFTSTSFNCLVSGSGYSSGTGNGIISEFYHTDGPGYLNGGVGPNNVTIVGNTAAMLGNTNALALQSATGGYQNYTINENFWSGDNGGTIALFQPGSTRGTNASFYANTFGTDVQGGVLYNPGAALGSTTTWACNAIEVRAGTTWNTFTNGHYYVNSASSVDSTTDQGGNTVCGATVPAATNFGTQATGTSSSTRTVTLYNISTSTLTGITPSLATGTQFAIVSNGCGSTLTSGANCSMTVKFAPTAQGPQIDTLKIADNSAGASSPQIVPLAGFATASVPTFYIAANGSDANAGTQSFPWLHAPGMSTCTSACASHTPAPGDRFIFRGGDTWHFGDSTKIPFVGFKTNAWNPTASGTAANCDVSPSSTVGTSSCIYWGVDQTYFTGSSWVRPIMNFDNPVSTTPPTVCAFNDWALDPVQFTGNYNIIDNFEWVGWCSHTSTGNGAIPFLIYMAGVGSEIKDGYYHGWSLDSTTMACTAADHGCDSFFIFNSVNSITQYTRNDHNYVDGTDSTLGNQVGCVPTSGYTKCGTGAVWEGGGEVDHNYVNQVSNGVKFTDVWTFHDNILDQFYESYGNSDGVHGNIFEQPTATSAGPWTIDTYAYNNVILRTQIGESFDMYPGSAAAGKGMFVFNNVMVNPDGNSGVNCYMLEGDASGGPGTVNFFNNTSVSQCFLRGLRLTAPTKMNVTFQNNQYLSYSPATLAQFISQGGITPLDNGNAIFQTTSAACGTATTYYAPNAASCQTVHHGANLSSLCSQMDNAAAAAACLNGIQGITFNATNHTVTDNPVSPRGSSWDAGAFEFQSSSGTVTLTPAPFTFAATFVGSTSAPQTFTLTNSTINPVTSIAVAVTGTNPSNFSIVGGTCTATLAVGASCTIQVTFSPDLATLRVGTLNVTDSDASSPQQAQMTGAGLAAAMLTPATQNYGTVFLGGSANATFTLTNSSSSTVTGISASLLGANPGDFAVSGGTCGSSLAGSSSCTIIVTFTPTTNFTRTATLSVSDSDPSSPQQSTLTGTGASVTVTPTSQSFGSVAVGSSSSPITFTLASNAPVPVTGITVQFITGNTGDWARSGGTCSTTLAANSSCTIIVVFTPTGVGARSTILDVNDSDTTAPQQSPLTGTGTSAGTVTLTPSSVSFGTIAIGLASMPVTFTLANSTASSLTGITITTIGTNAADFAQVGGTCSTTLSAGTNCTILVTFTPGAIGARTATLNVADSASGSPQQSALSGTGSVVQINAPCAACLE